ncbi:Flagellar hook protein FlgE [Fimbriiglobus ruber]|uniref:Flagellar hook protein FlgE n=1 Tax=Fimbriiglobus ruber TaxID=1908690 RepID=A0A225E0B1_9BACT|nr:Flagellar hook protein FlgE [Fimbriiglobus ruber]
MYTILIKTSHDGGTPAIAAIPVTVRAPVAAVSTSPIGAVVGVTTSDIEVVGFTQVDGTALQDTAIIDWGDGTTSPGTIVADPDYGSDFEVRGQHTYSGPGTFAVRVTLTDAGGYTHEIDTYATAVPAVNGWSTTQLSDDPTYGQSQALGDVSISLNTGALSVSQPLDFDLNPGTSVGLNPALVYNSAAAGGTPTVQLDLHSQNTDPLPDQIQVAFAWDGQEYGDPVTFTTGDREPGQDYVLSLPTNAPPDDKTGQFGWQAQVTFVSGTGSDVTDATGVFTGTAFVVDEANSPYGAGWGIAGVDTLIPVCGGLMWVTGTGGYEFFAQGTGDTYTSPAGTFGTLVYVPDEGYEYTAKDQTVSDFDAKGDLTLVTDRDGLTTQYAYNGDDSLASVTAADGGVTTFAYGGGGLAQITEPGGRAWTFAANGNLTGWTTPDGTTRTFEYDDDHHLTMDTWGAIETTVSYTDNVVTEVVRGDQTWTVDSVAGLGFADPVGTTATPAARVTDPLGYQTQYQVTSGDVPLAVTRPDGLTQTWKLLDGVLVTSATDFLGQTTTTQYGSVSGVTDGDVTGITNPDGSHLSYGYDPLYHQMTSSTDGNGNPTTYGLNATGDRTSTTDPLSDTTTDVWADGLLMSETDAVGDVTSYTYTQYRQTSTVTHTGPTGIVSSTATYTYDAAGNLSTMTDGVGDVTTYVYDGENRLVSTTDPDHNTTSTTYTPDGQVAGTTDANGIVTTYAYNTQGLVTQVVGNADGATAADRRTTLTAYDADGDPTAVTDPLGNVTRTYYDVDGRAVAVTDPNGYTSNTLYDADGNPTETVDNVGNTTLTAFDAMSRPISTAVYSSAATGSTLVTSNQTVYDADGNATLQTDGDGNQTQTRYDAANRLTYEADAAGTAAAVRTTTSYDPAGRATLVVDGTGDSTLTAYDAEGRSLGQTIVSAAGTVVTESTTQYDLAGRPTASVDPDGTTHLTGYDPAGRVTLSTSVDATGTVVAQTTTRYDQAGNPTATIDGDGHTTLTAYDAFGEATRVQSPAAGDGAATSAYDLDGRLTLATDADGNETYDVYDADGNLLSEEVDDAEGDVDTYSRKAYDPDGNLIGLIDGDSHVTSYAYDALGRQTTSDAGVDGPAGTDAKTTDAYDGAGNLTEVVDADGNVTQSAFDADNRLTAETLYDDEGDVVRQRTYAYDADGRQTLITDGVGNTTLSTYDAAGQLLTQTVRGPNTGGGTSHPDAREAAPAEATELPVAGQDSLAAQTGSSLVTRFAHPDGASQSATTTSLVSSANPTASGQAITFTATVASSPPGGGTPTGSVTFEDGTTVLGTATLTGGVATYATSALSAAPHGITAVYAGNGTFTTSTSAVLTEAVNPVSTVQLVGSTLVVQAPSTTNNTVNVAPSGSGSVTVVLNGTTVGTYSVPAGGVEVIDGGAGSQAQLTPAAGLNYTFVAGDPSDTLNVYAPATTGGSGIHFVTVAGASAGVAGTYVNTSQLSGGAALGSVWFSAAAPPTGVGLVGAGTADQFDVTLQAAASYSVFGNGGADTLNVNAPATATAGVHYVTYSGTVSGVVWGGVSATPAAGGALLGALSFYESSPFAAVGLYGTANADTFDVTPVAATAFYAIGNGGADVLNDYAPTTAGIVAATASGGAYTGINTTPFAGGASLGVVFAATANPFAAINLYGTANNDAFSVIPIAATTFDVYGNGGSGDVLYVNAPAAAGIHDTTYPGNGGTYVTTTAASGGRTWGPCGSRPPTRRGRPSCTGRRVPTRSTLPPRARPTTRCSGPAGPGTSCTTTPRRRPAGRRCITPRVPAATLPGRTWLRTGRPTAPSSGSSGTTRCRPRSPCLR